MSKTLILRRAVETQGTEPQPCVMRVAGPSGYLWELAREVILQMALPAMALGPCLPAVVRHVGLCLAFLIYKMMGLPQLRGYALRAPGDQLDSNMPLQRLVPANT